MDSASAGPTAAPGGSPSLQADEREPDPGRIAAWCHTAGILLEEPISISLISGGRSNLTYRVQDRANQNLVLRRPPFGPLMPGAHDMGREATIVQALGATDVPVPLLYGVCSDPAVIGSPFYLVEHVGGAPLTTDADGAALTESARMQASEQAVDVLARIHLLDVDAIGLGQLSRRDDYLSRQLRIWHKQFHRATRRHLPLIDEVHQALAFRAPPQRYTGLVHGDYRFGNMLLDGQGTINAVLDWELCALGDPLADLGWILATWREPGEPELYPSPSGNRGFLSRAQLLARYQEVTKREISDIAFYQAFALWRLACIYEGVYTRYRDGAMGDDGVDVEEQGQTVARLADAAHDVLHRG